jgi:hypothetical protein
MGFRRLAAIKNAQAVPPATQSQGRPLASRLQTAQKVAQSELAPLLECI